MYIWTFWILGSLAVNNSTLKLHVEERERKNNSQVHQHFTSSFIMRKCFAQLFSTYSFFLNFWPKNISSKAALKMLVKLTLRNIKWNTKVTMRWKSKRQQFKCANMIVLFFFRIWSFIRYHKVLTVLSSPETQFERLSFALCYKLP